MNFGGVKYGGTSKMQTKGPMDDTEKKHMGASLLAWRGPDADRPPKIGGVGAVQKRHHGGAQFLRHAPQC